MAYNRYDPTQYERQHRSPDDPRQHTITQCPNCGDSHHLVIVNGGLECWTCDEFVPEFVPRRRNANKERQP